MGAPKRNDLLELLDDRIGTRSTLITSQLPVRAWHTYLNDPPLADAILDRVVHSSHKIELKATKSIRNTAGGRLRRPGRGLMTWDQVRSKPTPDNRPETAHNRRPRSLKHTRGDVGFVQGLSVQPEPMPSALILRVQLGGQLLQGLAAAGQGPAQLVVGIGHVEEHAGRLHALSLGLHQARKALQLVELGAHAQATESQQSVQAGVKVAGRRSGGVGGGRQVDDHGHMLPAMASNLSLN
jgi:hypothetical protein